MTLQPTVDERRVIWKAVLLLLSAYILHAQAGNVRAGLWIWPGNATVQRKFLQSTVALYGNNSPSLSCLFTQAASFSTPFTKGHRCPRSHYGDAKSEIQRERDGDTERGRGSLKDISVCVVCMICEAVVVRSTEWAEWLYSRKETWRMPTIHINNPLFTYNAENCRHSDSIKVVLHNLRMPRTEKLTKSFLCNCESVMFSRICHGKYT